MTCVVVVISGGGAGVTSVYYCPYCGHHNWDS